MALWMRSYHRADALRVSPPWMLRYAIIFSGRGGILFGASPEPLVHFRAFRYDSEADPPDVGEGPPGTMRFEYAGFGVRAESPPYVVARCALWFPHWFLALLAAIAPARWAVRHVRQPQRRGFCVRCG